MGVLHHAINRLLIRVGLIERPVAPGGGSALPLFEPRNMVNPSYRINFTEPEGTIFSPWVSKGDASIARKGESAWHVI
jgi:hypothetical protein